MSTSSTTQQQQHQIPVGEKWDHSVENFVRKTATGFAAGTALALLSRTTLGRTVTMFSGAGFGAGMAYAEARYLFDYDICFDRRHVVSVSLYPPPPSSSSSSSSSS